MERFLAITLLASAFNPSHFGQKPEWKWNDPLAGERSGEQKRGTAGQAVTQPHPLAGQAAVDVGHAFGEREYVVDDCVADIAVQIF